MRLGVMGGTFDPIHHGHLVAASEVQALFDLDEVVFVPTGEPWQKADKRVSSAEHRYLMTVIATASNPRFTVSRVDIDRPGPTYTIDTLRDISAERPGDELFFITGADALAEILSWKDADHIWDLAHFVGVTRPGHVLSDKGLPEHRVTLQEVPAMAISSTGCRERVADGEPVWYLVPDGVVQYINKYGLYTGQQTLPVPGARPLTRVRPPTHHLTRPPTPTPPPPLTRMAGPPAEHPAVELTEHTKALLPQGDS